LPRRKPRPRLDHECYVGRDIYFVTICTNRNHHAFVKPDTISGFLYEMYEAAGHTHHSVAAYCAMPDHLHMLLIGKTSDSDVEIFVHRFKQRTGYFYKRITGKKLWQTSYYDHMLREEEDLTEVVNYIVSNPERSGLVKDYREYPWIGSQIYDVRALQ